MRTTETKKSSGWGVIQKKLREWREGLLTFLGLALGYFIYNFLFGEGNVLPYIVFLVMAFIPLLFSFYVIASILIRFLPSRTSFILTPIIILGVLASFLFVTPEDVKNEMMVSPSGCLPSGYREALAARLYPRLFWLENHKFINEVVASQEKRVLNLPTTFDETKDRFDVIRQTILEIGYYPNVVNARELERDMISDSNEEIDRLINRLVSYYQDEPPLVHAIREREQIWRQAAELRIRKLWANQSEELVGVTAELWLLELDASSGLEPLLYYKECEGKIREKILEDYKQVEG